MQSLFGDLLKRPSTPTILGLSPPQGSTGGGTATVVTGLNFRAECRIAFGGVASVSTLVNATTIHATAPAHMAGSVDILLTCGSDSFTFVDGFTYLAAPPQLSLLTPLSGTAAGGTHIRALGSDFDGSCWLFFGGSAASEVLVQGPDSITGVTPASPRGASAVTVTCSAGSSTVDGAFAFVSGDDPAPLILGVNPTAAAPGEPITIRGSSFRPANRVQFDGVDAEILQAFPDFYIVRVPELPTGRTSIDVKDAAGRFSTTGPVVTVLESRPPTITAISPAVVSAGGEVELTGEAFRPGYSFEIAGYPATTVTMTRERAVVRLNRNVLTGSHRVRLLTRSGHLSSMGPAVDVLGEGMVVSSADPRCATTIGGSLATIHGRGFSPGLSVSFNGTPATEVSFVNATTLRVRVPPGEAGLARIFVSGPNQPSSSLTNAFRYQSPFDPGRGCSGKIRTVRH